MDGKKIDTRILHKHDTEANWDQNASSFVPKAGELIIYDVDSENPAPRFKVGNGLDEIDNLPFVTGTYANNILMSQDNNNTIADAIAAAGKVETVANVGVATGTKNVPLTGADIPMSASDSTRVANAIAKKADIPGWYNMGVISSLPITRFSTDFTTDMICTHAQLGTPSAQTSDWTVNTDTAGQVKISGSIASGTSTTLFIKLEKVRNVTPAENP